MDATYRSDLREVNELNFARFDSKLHQGLAELKAELIKWMFVLWAGTTFTVLGAVFAIVRL